MNYFLLSISALSFVASNSVQKYVGIKTLHSDGDIYKFNAFSFGFCIIFFAVLSIGSGFSAFSVGTGVIFGVLTVFATVYKMKAYKSGPMTPTVLATTSSMIIPSVSGTLFFGEEFKLLKTVAMLFFIGCVVFSLSKPKTENSGSIEAEHEDCKKITSKWFLYCAIAFFSTGFIGLLQKFHQNSIHKDELFAFLASAFLVSCVYAVIESKIKKTEVLVDSKFVFFAGIVGVCTFANNFLNLRLSGVIPSQIFFPLANGVPVLLLTIFSKLIFKEKLSKRQVIGLCGGALSIIAICFL